MKHLSPEQKHVLRLVRAGQNVFFTGPAGMLASIILPVSCGTNRY